MTQAGSGRGSGLSLPLLGFFVFSRVLLFQWLLGVTDVHIYARYAREQAVAARAGISFSELHARRIEQQAQVERGLEGDLAVNIDEYKNVEYPPLALAFMRLPTLWIGGPEDGTAKVSFEDRYRLAFQIMMVVVDGGLFLLLLVLVRRSHSAVNEGEAGTRLLLYTLATLMLWHLLYDRLDLLQAALVVLSLALLTSRWHYGWSFLVLAAAVLFKVVPVVLAPLWVVAAMPADRPLQFRRPQVLANLAVRAALLVGLVVVGMLPFYALDGHRCLDFLEYHRARPLEIESVPASLALVLGPLGQPATAFYSYGSINLQSPITPALVALSPWLTAAVLLAATVLLMVHFQHEQRLARQLELSAVVQAVDSQRSLIQAPIGAPSGDTLGRAHPHLVVGYALLLFMLYITTSKVFSTQYLLWLAPLVVLLPQRQGRQRLFAVGLLLLSVLSTILVPFLFVIDLIDRTAPPPPHPLPLAIQQPTIRLAVLLVVRNLLFLGLLTTLVAQLVRSGLRKDQG
jgi:hypothetical protein